MRRRCLCFKTMETKGELNWHSRLNQHRRTDLLLCANAGAKNRHRCSGLTSALTLTHARIAVFAYVVKPKRY